MSFSDLCRDRRRVRVDHLLRLRLNLRLGSWQGWGRGLRTAQLHVSATSGLLVVGPRGPLGTATATGRRMGGGCLSPKRDDPKGRGTGPGNRDFLCLYFICCPHVHVL